MVPRLTFEFKNLTSTRYKLNMDEKVIQAGMFNNRSTGSERRELLQSILRADDQEEEEENEAPDDETINQVCSRSGQSGFKTVSPSKRFAF